MMNIEEAKELEARIIDATEVLNELMHRAVDGGFCISVETYDRAELGREFRYVHVHVDATIRPSSLLVEQLSLMKEGD